MRLLHLSDTHLGAELRVRGAPPGWSRADDHLAAMEAALAPALDERVDLVVHTGDLFDRSQPPPEAVAAAIVLLHKVSRRVPVVLIPGNHDRRGLQGHLVETDRLHVHDQPTRLVVRGLALALVPFHAEARAWAGAARQAVGPGVDLLLSHQSFHGSRVPGFRFRAGHIPETVGPEYLPSTPLIAAGHIHTRQAFQLEHTTVVHCGSTERTSYNERDETKGYVLWELERGARWRHVDLPARPMAWITHPDQIDEAEPGVLTGIARELRCVEHEAALLARGVWLSGRPSEAPPPRPRGPDRQRGLFTDR